MKLLSLAFVILLLQGCFSSGESGVTFSVDKTQITFSGNHGGTIPDSQTIIGTVSGAEEQIWVYIEIPDTTLIYEPTVSLEGETGTLRLVPKPPYGLTVGTHSQTLVIKVCEDAVCNSQVSGSPVSIKLKYIVGGDPNNPDADNDGIPDDQDAFPQDPKESLDTDNDGIGNSVDDDDDGDGVLDVNDAFPLDGTESIDTDGDSIGNNADTDDDGDFYLDTNDAFPLDEAEWLDTDGDQIGNNADADDDGDSYLDTNDAFPLDETEWIDTDGDFIGNNADTDDDGDSYLDINDAFPLDETEWLDTDGDSIGNNADTDDDGDSYLDTNDAFPLDETEWLDTDGDLIGNNADDNDDGDIFLDVDDAFPLDNTAPAKLISIAPSAITADQETSVVVSGLQFSNKDSFSINGVSITKKATYDNGVELNLPTLAAGQHTVTVSYEGSDYTSEVNLMVLASGYHKYAELFEGGIKSKAYFVDQTQSLYVFNKTLSQLSKYQLVSGEGWVSSVLPLAGAYSVALSKDKTSLYAIKSDSILRIALDSFTAGEEKQLDPGYRTYFSDGEFDGLGALVLVSDYNGSGSTNVKRLGLNSELPGFDELTSVARLYNSAIAVSGNGAHILLGESGLSPVQPLVKYNPFNGAVAEVNPTYQYSTADLSDNGERILVNNKDIYNQTYSLLGSLSSVSTLSASALSWDGNLTLATDADNVYLYDTSDLNGGNVIYSHSVTLDENLGTVREILISKDKLTAFLIGDNKIQVVPVWQIEESSVGSATQCPSAGCGDISVYSGVTLNAVSPDPVAINNTESGIEFLSPSYGFTGWNNELLITGTGFSQGDVVQFGNTVADSVVVESATVMRVKVPNLAAADYSVTVNGEGLNAPTYTVHGASSASDNVWLLGGNPAEMKFNLPENALYVLDSTGDYLHRLNLSDNSVISLNEAGANDFAICPQNDSVLVGNGSEIKSYDLDTLTNGSVVAVVNNTTFECAASNKLIIAYSDQWEYVGEWDLNNSTSKSVGSLMYYPAITPSSLLADQFVVSENGISSPDRLYLKPYVDSSSAWANQGSIKHTAWSANGRLGLIRSSGINLVNNTYAELADFSFISDTLLTMTISLDGSTAYLVSSDTVYKVLLDGDWDSLSVETSYTFDVQVGTPKKIVTNEDGSRIFLAGTNAIESISF